MSATEKGTPLEPLLKEIMVAGEPFHQLVAYGGGGHSHWAQVLCPSCGAWLRTQPDSSENSGSGYTYLWTCLNCGAVRRRNEFSPPESWSIDPERTEHVPGSFPAVADWDPYVWLDGSGLPAQDIAFARDGWSLLAEFALEAEDPAIGRSAVLEAEAEARHPPEALIQAVRIELEADPPGRRMLEGPRLWQRADDFMREVVKPIRDEDMWGRSLSYRVTFADGHALDSSTRLYAGDQPSLSGQIRRARLASYLHNLASQPEHVHDFADADRVFLNRYKIGPGRHERKELAQSMFTAPQTLADIRNALDRRQDRLLHEARVRRFENASEPIRTGAAALKLAAKESLCEALEGKDATRGNQAKEAMVRLGRLESYVPSFEVREHPTLQKRLEYAAAVISDYEMMHTADTLSDLQSDEKRLAHALEAWRAYLEASRA